MYKTQEYLPADFTRKQTTDLLPGTLVQAETGLQENRSINRVKSLKTWEKTYSLYCFSVDCYFFVSKRFSLRHKYSWLE